MEYKRICPNCGREITYKYKSTMDSANKVNSPCRCCSGRKTGDKLRMGNLSKLLLNSNEAFYWIGYLLSDGSFSDYRLSFGQSIKDEEQVKKFGNFIEYIGDYNRILKNGKSFIELSIQDVKFVPLIKEKFNINKAKTYNPPKTILKWDENLILSMFAGFIDGDGGICKKTNRKDAKLKIQVHCSWINILKEFNSIISDKNLCKINSRGYAELGIEDFPILRNLKIKILKLNIPILKRKWDCIDETFINRIEKTKIIKNNIINDYNNGINRKIIAEKYDVSQPFITKILKDNKND